MAKVKVYLETTVFNHFFDTDRPTHANTIELFTDIKAGKYEPYTSPYTIKELADTPDPKKRADMLKLIDDYGIESLPETDEVSALARKYIEAGVIPPTYFNDAAQVAIATVYGLDMIVSSNFTHISRAKTRLGTSEINIANHYKPIDINSP